MAALVVALAVASASTADASMRVFTPAKAGARTFTFKLKDVEPRSIVRASLVRGRHARKLSERRARRAARRGSLRIRRSRWKKPPRLKVIVKKPEPKPVRPAPIVTPAPEPVPAPDAAPAPDSADPQDSGPLDVLIPDQEAPQAEAPAPGPGELFRDPFTGPDGVITNHHAFWSPSDRSAFRSADWEMESGCALRKDNTLWTGVPTSNIPNADCSNGSGSDVFRLWTKRSDFGDVTVSFSLRNNGFVTGRGESWDGIKIWLRRQGGTGSVGLYTAEVNRREGNLLIQKKCEGSSEYEILGQNRPLGAEASIDQWETVGGTVRNLPDGNVQLELVRHGQVVLSATDSGVGCAPLTDPGKVGIRGDRTDFNVDDFVVSPAS